MATESSYVSLCSSNGDHDLEVSIGRIPSNNISEAKDYVDKLYLYSQKNQVKGDWKKNIYLISDDGDNNVHQNDGHHQNDHLNDHRQNDHQILILILILTLILTLMLIICIKK